MKRTITVAALTPSTIAVTPITETAERSEMFNVPGDSVDQHSDGLAGR